MARPSPWMSKSPPPKPAKNRLDAMESALKQFVTTMLVASRCLADQLEANQKRFTKKGKR